MRLAIVGEAWGRHETQHQHPLVGPTGRELTLQAGFAGLMPHLELRCRKCKTLTQFITPHCSNCGEFIWPSELDLIAHWKKMKAEHDVHISNVFNTQPPNICATCNSLDINLFGRRALCSTCGSSHIRTNEIGFFFGTEQQTEMPGWKASKNFGGSHIKLEHFHHVKRLWRELDDLTPNLVIAMGNTACWALFKTSPKITNLRGTVNWSEHLGLKILPTYHPAMILREPKMRPTVIADLMKAQRERAYPQIERTKRWITIVEPTTEGIAEAYQWFKKPASAYANDIETVRGQISIIGFARSIDDALVIVFRDCHSEHGKLVEIGKTRQFLGLEPSINFWPCAKLETQAWKLAIHGLQTPQPKIFQNGAFDLSYYIRIGIHPKNALHDTMLWHHSQYPELPKSLGYLGSVYANEVAWKLMARSNDTLKRDE